MLSKGTKVSVKVETLVLFGATGDLAQRMLFPSLYNLHLDGLLASELTIIGSGRSKMDRAAFQVQVQGALAEHLPADRIDEAGVERSEEHTSELQSLMRNSYAVFCLKTKRSNNTTAQITTEE